MVLEGMMSVEGMVWWCWKERCLWNGWCDGVGRNGICGRDGVIVLEGMMSVEWMV